MAVKGVLLSSTFQLSLHLVFFSSEMLFLGTSRIREEAGSAGSLLSITYIISPFTATVPHQVLCVHWGVV